MTHHLLVDQFLKAEGELIDVRSPTEYTHAHIPDARSLPLFSDEERSQVGSAYKQLGKEKALEIGLRLVGPKLEYLLTTAKKQLKNKPAKVYCARGGMRSGSLSWLLSFAGIETVTLEGGYKSFRRWALKVLREPRRLIVLGGLTGVGKTAVLAGLKEIGEQVIDLEAMANHRGSSFGRLGEQPSNEQLENQLAVKWAAFNPKRPIWIEDESRSLGHCQLPEALFSQIRESSVLVMECPIEERIARTEALYGNQTEGELVAATLRIKKRLGGERTDRAIAAIKGGERQEAIRTILYYYDKTYEEGLKQRQGLVVRIQSSKKSPELLASELHKAAYALDPP